MNQLLIAVLMGCSATPALAAGLVDDAKDQCVAQNHSWHPNSTITDFYPTINGGPSLSNKTVYFGVSNGNIYQVKIPRDEAEAAINTVLISNLFAAHTLQNTLDLCVDDATTLPSLLGVHIDAP